MSDEQDSGESPKKGFWGRVKERAFGSGESESKPRPAFGSEEWEKKTGDTIIRESKKAVKYAGKKVGGAAGFFAESSYEAVKPVAEMGEAGLGAIKRESVEASNRRGFLGGPSIERHEKLKSEMKGEEYVKPESPSLKERYLGAKGTLLAMREDVKKRVNEKLSESRLKESNEEATKEMLGVETKKERKARFKKELEVTFDKGVEGAEALSKDVYSGLKQATARGNKRGRFVKISKKRLQGLVGMQRMGQGGGQVSSSQQSSGFTLGRQYEQSPEQRFEGQVESGYGISPRNYSIGNDGAGSSGLNPEVGKSRMMSIIEGNAKKRSSPGVGEAMISRLALKRQSGGPKYSLGPKFGEISTGNGGGFSIKTAGLNVGAFKGIKVGLGGMNKKPGNSFGSMKVGGLKGMKFGSSKGSSMSFKNIGVGRLKVFSGGRAKGIGIGKFGLASMKPQKSFSPLKATGFSMKRAGTLKPVKLKRYF